MPAVDEKSVLEANVRAQIERKKDKFQPIGSSDLLDCKIIIMPSGIKHLTNYSKLYGSIESRYLVFVNTNRENAIHLLAVKYNSTEKKIYISVDRFNEIWRFLRKSILKEMSNNSNGKTCKWSPEDLLDLTELHSFTDTAIVKDDVIQYKPVEIDKKEKRACSKMKNLLVNDKNLYFYDYKGQEFHDRECNALRFINPNNIRASEYKPRGKHPCANCYRYLLLRKACSRNPTHFRAIDRILFTRFKISDSEIEKYVEDYGLNFEIVKTGKFKVYSTEDTWVLVRNSGDKFKLYHNNYRRIGITQRKMNSGFHLQKIKGN